MNPDSGLRIGVIGAGIMGTDHALLAARTVAGVRVTAVCDVDRERATALADRLDDARVAGSALELIAADDVDAVIIAAADASHAELTLAAVAAGKPVLCEKPLAPTVDECAAIVAAEDAGGARLVSVGFMRRFDPAHVRLRQAIADGAVGRPVLVHCRSRGVSSAAGASSVSSITGSAIHEFDTVPWLLSAPVVEVGWHAPASAVDGWHDPQLILLRTADGALATIEVFLNARSGYDIGCEVVGTEGSGQLPVAADVVLTSGLRRWTAQPADWRPRFAAAYRLELQAWADAIRRGEPAALADARDGLRATGVAAAAVGSMKDGGAWLPVDAGPGDSGVLPP